MNPTIPSGTVTFLFSDIEASTRQWENHQEWMQWAFKRQEQIMRQVMAEHGGYVYKMIGDAFQVAFDTAPDAVRAALAAQRALAAEDWGEHGPIRVRMALHTGVTEERGDDYVGPTLNRVARVMSAGYGGQVLLTQATYDLVQDDLPPGVTLRDLGEHRLKDLVRPEHIYQLVAPGLQEDFPPLKTLSSLPNNLPLQRTSFVGREREIAEVRRLLEHHRLVTITGPGGTGKTRLALQVASELLECYEDGVWLVELAPLADPLLIPQTVAAALGVGESPGKTVTQALVEYLHPRQALLIFDNCEHILEDTVMLIDTLLRACPRLRVLTTSREILGASGEANFRCPSLATPPRDLHSADFAQLAGFEAVQLFMERAAAASPGLTLTEQNAPLVARICQRLDGIPLAIELAAARVRMFGIEGVAARLDDTFRLLTGGSRSALPRQQTLRACIDWSYNLLSPAERLLFQRLAVFAGGWILEAAEQVCADPVKPSGMGAAHIDLEEEEILDLLTQLVDKSLVMTQPIGGQRLAGAGETRFYLLDTIRAYARERLQDEGGGPQVRSRHLAYYLMLAEEAEPHLRGRDQVAWLDRIEFELDNIRYALEWSLSGEVEAGLRLAAALVWFWHVREYAAEGVDWLVRLLEAESRLAPAERRPGRVSARARALRAAGMLLVFRDHHDRGVPLLEESAELFASLGEAGRLDYAITLVYLAITPLDYEKRLKMARQALETLTPSENRFYLAETLMTLSHLMGEREDHEAARQYATEALALRRALNDLDGLGMGYLDLGQVEFHSGHEEQAEELFKEAMEYFKAVGNKRMVMNIQSILGNIAMLRGNTSEAAARFEENMRMGRASGDQYAIAQALNDLGRLAWQQGDYQQAADYFEQMAGLVQDPSYDNYRAFALFWLGYAVLSMGEAARAHQIYRDAIALARAASGGRHEPSVVIPVLVMLAQLLAARGLYERAVQVFGKVRQSPIWNSILLTPKERAAGEKALEAARAALGEAAFAAAWEQGERMSLDEIVNLALAEPE